MVWNKGHDRGGIPIAPVMRLMLAVLLLAGCAGGEEANPTLCEGVEEIAGLRADASRTLGTEPEATAVASHYEELATLYREVAGSLSNESSVESTRDLATLLDDGAELLAEHQGADSGQLRDLARESEVFRALEERMSMDPPMGFTPSAWEEIETRCEVAVDPTARREP